MTKKLYTLDCCTECPHVHFVGENPDFKLWCGVLERESEFSDDAPGYFPDFCPLPDAPEATAGSDGENLLDAWFPRPDSDDHHMPPVAGQGQGSIIERLETMQNHIAANASEVAQRWYDAQAQEAEHARRNRYYKKG